MKTASSKLRMESHPGQRNSNPPEVAHFLAGTVALSLIKVSRQHSSEAEGGGSCRWSQSFGWECPVMIQGLSYCRFWLECWKMKVQGHLLSLKDIYSSHCISIFNFFLNIHTACDPTLMHTVAEWFLKEKKKVKWTLYAAHDIFMSILNVFLHTLKW